MVGAALGYSHRVAVDIAERGERFPLLPAPHLRINKIRFNAEGRRGKGMETGEDSTGAWVTQKEDTHQGSVKEGRKGGYGGFKKTKCTVSAQKRALEICI